MDRIADSGSADGGSNPSGHTGKLIEATLIYLEWLLYFFCVHVIYMTGY